MADELLHDEAKTAVKSKRRQRSIILAADFTGGYAVGWVMAVPSCFHSALDIELTPRVEKNAETGIKQKVLKWTEGMPPIYSFGRGDTIYDTKAGYDPSWELALSHISVSLQVAEATPDRLKGPKTKTAGWVVVREFRPRRNRSGLDFKKQHRMTQDEFVGLLKTGLLPNGTRL